MFLFSFNNFKAFLLSDMCIGRWSVGIGGHKVASRFNQDLYSWQLLQDGLSMMHK